MVKRKISMAAVCSLILCIALCGCGVSRNSEVIVIGHEGQENAQLSGNLSEGLGQGALTADTSAESYGGLEQAAPAEIRVHVCGAVKEPGVVSLPAGSRAEEALLAAGGFAENAWRDYVNLAERVEDGQKLYFPTLEEAGSLVELESADGRVNINTADVFALCTLPGIGESRAKDIIAYREANGAFKNCEDIMKVPGIKTSVYSKISGMIKVE